jgi:prepilin-type processing-associated H-X9-DG protein
MVASHLAGCTFSVQVRENAATAKAVERLVQSVNRELKSRSFGAAPGIRRVGTATGVKTTILPGGSAALEFRRLPRHRLAYALDLPRGSLPPPFVTALRPTIVLEGDQLVIGASTAAAERALAGGPRWQPPLALVPVVRHLPADMVYLNVSDSRVTIPILSKILPILVQQINVEIGLAQQAIGKTPKDVSLRLDPGMIPPAEELSCLLFPSSTTVVVDGQGASLTHREPVPTATSPATVAAMIALVIPALRREREAARRDQCTMNLRRIAAAMHNYHSANNAFPGPAICDEKGNPLLSWRVAILPWLGEQGLYSKFKLVEPWDSPHNKALLKEMPPVYLCPSRTRFEAFTTNYRVVAGPGALFEEDQDVAIADVTDGTSNTLMIIEAKEAVPWTKPESLPFDPKAAASRHGAGSPHAGGFNACFADGAVRFLKNTIDVKVFRALVTRNGGEAIGPEAF